MQWNQALILACWFGSMVIACTTATAAEEPVAFFREQVLPIFEKRCLGCHSHSHQIESSLSLDWKSGWTLGGTRGPAIVPGDVENSLLIKAIRHVDNDLKMPESRLPQSEIDVLEEWVRSGAFDDRVAEPAYATKRDALDWWSLRPIAAPQPPPGDLADLNENPIDSFINARLQQAGLQFSPPADRRTLVRRLYVDLIGLPPTPEEIDRFLEDDSADAYSQLVDRLLGSVRYGERWARHWFDTIHFAESHGYEHDVGRDHAWRYRDYVIEALNADLPWQDFVREQLAADYFCSDDPRKTPALGFLGAGTFDLSTYSTAVATFDYLARDDLVHQTMSAFVSTTANCARCHDHKFDPISQEDYYALQAVFSGVLKGDIAYDEDRAVAFQRAQLKARLDACDRRDPEVLLRPEVTSAVDRWASEAVRNQLWSPLIAPQAVADSGIPLQPTAEGAWLATGDAPDVDVYRIHGKSQLDRISAVRLDLLTDASLPGGGPGRAVNGNTHLCEFEIWVAHGEDSPFTQVRLAKATADFNQVQWGVEKAIDGNDETAWGIDPEEGKPHYAIFQLTDPVRMQPQTRMQILLKQIHGRKHVIGAFRIGLSDAEPGQLTALPLPVNEALRRPAAERSESEKLTLAAYWLRSVTESEINQLPPQQVVYAAGHSVQIPTGNGNYQTASLPVAKVVHVLHRGEFDKPRSEIGPGAIASIEGLQSRFAFGRNGGTEAERRAALANWIVDRDNPLTWRSIVNRVWHYHFGRGLSDTPSDFGRMGGVPSHPELLDWLARWFRDDAGGTLKKLHRLIVSSRTYRQASRPNVRGNEFDQDNRLLWRQNQMRLDADVIRDALMLASGSLDYQMKGPSVQHFLQSKGPQSTPVLNYQGFDWRSPGASRRSIYRYVWRGIADPFMEALDFPDLGLLSPQRGVSASPMQALTLFNDRMVLFYSQQMADDVQRWVDQDVSAQVVCAVQRCWGRRPDDKELDAMEHFVRRNGLAALCRVLINSNEFLFLH